MGTLRRSSATALGLAALLAAVSACGGGSSDGASGSGSGDGKAGGTMVFGTSADPVSMDGAYVSDGESLRVVRQLFETLVTTKPGGTEIEPLLATKYEPSEDGKTWTFDLRKGVKFHDGTDFDAEAVCANFDRWYNFSGVQQSASVSYYWQTVFSGYKNNEDPSLAESLYAGCEAKGEQAVIYADLAVGVLPVRPGAGVVLDRQPRRADEVRGGQGHRLGRGAPLRGHLRHPEPDRHRAVPARDVRAEQPPRPGPLRRLLG